MDQPQAPKPGGKSPLRVFLTAAAGGLLFAAAAGVAAVGYLGGRILARTESDLRRYVFTDPSRASFDRLGMDWLRGRVSLKGLKVRVVAPGGLVVDGGAEAIAVPIPLRAILSGRYEIDRVVVERPVLGVDISTSSRDAGASPPISAAWGSLGQLAKTSLRELDASDGSVLLQYEGGVRPLEFKDISIEVKRLGGAGQGYSVSVRGQLGQDPNAVLQLEAKLYEPDPAGQFEGEVKLNGMPIRSLADLFPADPDIKFQSGRLTIRSQFNCRNGWLASSHLVEISDFKVDVSPKRDEISGVSTKYLKDLFNIDHLSFDVPMSGSLADPHIGVASSVEQILLKLLEDKFKDKDKAEKWAKWGGDRFGGQIDKAIKAALRPEKR